jgi:hypothetical protein
MSYDLGDRAEFGFRKYGTYLQANNGRNAVMDAYQEALDLVVYLKQCCMEGKSLELEYQSALGIARQLCRTLIG